MSNDKKSVDQIAIELLKDPQNWKQIEDEENSYYHLYRPQFIFIQDENENLQDFHEPWVQEFINPKAYKTRFNLQYQSTKLKRFYVLSLIHI